MFDCKCSCHHGDEEKEAVEEGEKESEKKFKFPLKKVRSLIIIYKLLVLVINNTFFLDIICSFKNLISNSKI